MKRPRTPHLAFILLALTGTALAANEHTWTASWYSAAIEYTPYFEHATVRTTIRLTTGGDRLRLRFSNFYGRSPLKIDRVRVTAASESKDVTFDGRLQTVLPPGAVAVSDAVNLRSEAESLLAISVFYPNAIPRETTQQSGTAESNTLTLGDAITHPDAAKNAKTLDATYFLSGVDIYSKGSHGTIVVVADSMTGEGSNKWPALLAARLAKDGKNYGVLNASVGGNRILRDSQIAYGGPSLLTRFDRDALNQPGVRYVILFEGHNDIGVGRLDGIDQPQSASSDDIINGMRNLIERCHTHGVKLYIATLIPIAGMPSNYYSPEKARVRRAVNDWIRSSREIDGYFDFDRALADVARPEWINPQLEYAAHPNEFGQKALSESINLSFFE